MGVRTLVSVLCCAIAACAPVPIFPTDNPLPYRGEKYSSVHLKSTPEQVVGILGQPQVKLQDGTLWIYGQSRAELSDGLGYFHHDYQAVMIEFSQGMVISKGLVSGENLYQVACWSSGRDLCLQPFWEAKSDAKDAPKILSRRYAAITSHREDDALAKRFAPGGEHCAVYVYSGIGFAGDPYLPPTLSLAHFRDEPVPDTAYLYLNSPPGHLELQSGSSSVTIDCQPGSLYFYQLRRPLFGDREDIGIKTISKDKGKEAVGKRFRLVTW